MNSLFTLKLLTSVKTNNIKISYLETTISEFYPQKITSEGTLPPTINQNLTYCYSFNEKFSVHNNGQKELSFSMLQDIWVGDRRTTNPFINNLHIGSQLLLIDKYGNEYFFTIKDIKHTFKQDNKVLDYSCQDSFSYQHIRQNAGYEIVNDAETEDFIGAKDVDWWVVNKIQPDCYIAYQYIPLFQGLYVDNEGNTQTYFNNSEITNCAKIIKPIYDKELHKEYYEKIPFSVSGGNAASSLISLAETIGLSLNYKENNIKSGGIRTNNFERYFWFEPTKDENISGLKYSPYNSIQSFGLNYEGSALTTVLNIEPNTINDEIISVIPEVPLFFQNLFSSSEWLKTSYMDGFFTAACQSVTFKSEEGKSPEIQYNNFISQENTITKDGKLFIQLWNKVTKDKDGNNQFVFKLPGLYDRVKLYSDGYVSYIYVDDRRYSFSDSKWQLLINNQPIAEYIESISSNLWGSEVDLKLSIEIPGISDISQIGTSEVVLNFYRDASEEELYFAEMADKCPWLENKLIDLNFFLTNNIITKQEYAEVMNIIKNDLRIINGQLLLYTASYYQALHSKTQLLAELTNDLDSLGAAFMADVLSPYSQKGEITDIDYFVNAYNTLSTIYWTNLKQTPIANYNDLLTEYLNKYISVQQKFLKNVYNFKKYFNSPVSWGDEFKLYNYTIAIEDINSTEDDGLTVTFDKEDFEVADDNMWDTKTGKPKCALFDSKKNFPLEIVHLDNYKNYYVSVLFDNLIYCDSEEYYNPNTIYYRMVYKTENKNLNRLITWEEQVDGDFEGRVITFERYKVASDGVYYAYSKIDDMDFAPNEFDYQGNIFKKDYLPVKYDEIVTEYLYSIWSSKLNWYLVEYNPLIAIKNLREYKDAIKYWNNNNATKDYITNFPVKTIYFTNQPQYEAVPFTFIDETKINYQRINDAGYTVSDYLNYITKNPQAIITKEGMQNPADSTVTYSMSLVTPENQDRWYRKVKDKWQTKGLPDYNIYGEEVTGDIWTYEKPIYAISEDAEIRSQEKIKERENDFFYNIYYSTTDRYLDNSEKVLKYLSTDTKECIVGEHDKNVIGTQYFDFYQYYGLTLASAAAIYSPTVKYQESGYYERVAVDHSTSLKANADYYIIELTTEGGPFRKDVTGKPELPNDWMKDSISRTVWFYLDKYTKRIETSGSLKSILEKVYGNLIEIKIDGKFIKITSPLDSFYIMIVKRKDYITTEKVFNNNKYLTHRFSLYQNQVDIVDINLEEKVDLINKKGLVRGFFAHNPSQDDFTTPTIDKNTQYALEDLDKLKLYKVSGNNFTRVYTINQLNKQQKLYYLKSSLYTENSFDANASFSINLNLHQVKNNMLTTTTTKQPFVFNYINDDAHIATIQDGGNIYQFKYTIKRTETHAPDMNSNGGFWYRYHNELSNPILLEKAAAIETQLQMYWGQAYSASLYCEYFIPEYWQPSVRGKANYFSDKVVSVDENGNVSLSSEVLPQIEVISINGQTRLPTYTLKWNKTATKTEDVIKQQVNSFNEKNGLILKQNKAFVNIMNELSETFNNIVVEENEYKTSNYYAATGGLRWNEILPKYSKFYGRYDFFNGLHIMMYKILRQNFTNREFATYDKLQAQKAALWLELYTKHSGCILEDTFSNADATTADELYILAKNALRDKTEPEKGYSISIIDPRNIFGYNGQEVKIGTGIQIDAPEYHDRGDKLQKDISQFLFITDLSYDLRKPENLQITVNAIKYQDKLIQRLAKLIK